MAAPSTSTPPQPAADRITLRPGEHYVGRGKATLYTLLGSCVSIILWQPALRVGAMSHFLLGTRHREPDTPLDGRYGDEAMQLMLRDLTHHRARLRDCQARLVGGGDMFPNGVHVMDIGRRNGEAARELLLRHGLAPCGEHLFGQGHRQVQFNLNTGEVRVRHTPAAVAPISISACNP